MKKRKQDKIQEMEVKSDTEEQHHMRSQSQKYVVLIIAINAISIQFIPPDIDFIVALSTWVWFSERVPLAVAPSIGTW